TARPGLDHQGERLAVRHLSLRADLLEHRLECDLERRGNLNLPLDVDGSDFLLDIAHRHAQRLSLDVSCPVLRSLAFRSALCLIRASWRSQNGSKSRTQS